MSEKLKPNFTPVPNIIFDEIMRGLSSAGELKALLAICRFTYGWGKKSDRISLKQLKEITGIKDRSNVHRAVKGLGNLIVVVPGDPSKNLASEYRINFEISDDLLSQTQQELLSEGQHPVVRPVVSNATFQRKSKERRNKSASRKTRERADTDPRVKTLITAFFDKYLAKVGSRPVITAKDAASLKRLLTAGHDVPVVASAMDRYFASKFYSDTGFDAAGFAKAFNRLNSAGARKRNYEDGVLPEL